MLDRTILSLRRRRRGRRLGRHRPTVISLRRETRRSGNGMSVRRTCHWRPFDLVVARSTFPRVDAGCRRRQALRLNVGTTQPRSRRRGAADRSGGRNGSSSFTPPPRPLDGAIDHLVSKLGIQRLDNVLHHDGSGGGRGDFPPPPPPAAAADRDKLARWGCKNGARTPQAGAGAGADAGADAGARAEVDAMIPASREGTSRATRPRRRRREWWSSPRWSRFG